MTSIMTREFSPANRHHPELCRTRNQIDSGIRAMINHVVRGESPWPLVLFGGAGRGKTCAALCVLDYWLIEYKQRGVYAITSEVVSSLGKARCNRLFYPGGFLCSEETLWGDWESYGIVCIDELGMRDEVSDTHFEAVKLAIDHRHNKPAIFVSNIRLSELVGNYDTRIASRLRAGTVIEFTGPDRRIRK